MIHRAARLVVAAASLGAAAAIGTAPADATTPTPTHVGIVVRLSSSSTLTACVTSGGNGLDVLVRGFPNTDIPTSGPYAGFVVSINDVGQNPPDTTHYWSYWHATASGWKYSSTGGGSYTPKAGAVEGWSYVAGQNNAPKPPTYSYQTLCGSKDPKPAPTSTHPTPTPRHQQTPSSSHARTHARAPSSSASPPPSASTTRRSRHPAARPPTSHAAAATHHRHSRRSATAPSSTPLPASPRPLSTAAAAPVPSPSLRATAGQRSNAGFPAWGTVLGIVVVAVLGGAAWLRLRHRPE